MRASSTQECLPGGARLDARKLSFNCMNPQIKCGGSDVGVLNSMSGICMQMAGRCSHSISLNKVYLEVNIHVGRMACEPPQCVIRSLLSQCLDHELEDLLVGFAYNKNESMKLGFQQERQ